MYTKIDDIKIYYDFNDGIKVNVDGPDNFYYVEVREYQRSLKLVNLFNHIISQTRTFTVKKEYFNLTLSSIWILKY